jgi:ribonuclease VapC
VIAIDTSPVIAILLLEPEANAFSELIAADEGSCMSAVSLQKASMVLAGNKHDSARWAGLERLVSRSGIEIIPHDEALARIARDAFLRFGKGRHPARLNCGDCASYALAKSRRIPLLFKGTDFAHTDLRAAIAAPPA